MQLQSAQKPLVILAALAVTAYLAVGTITAVSQSILIGNQAALIQTLSGNSDALREQVKDAGETPIAPTAKTAKAEAKAGEAGAAGRDGVPGPRGFTGDQGVRGDSGATGVAGVLGAVGPVGSDGLNGSDGLAGATGAAGADGSDGAPGADGATGAKGATGIDGDTGRGIADVACQDDGDWLFTMTDESTTTVTGPCRVGIPATPKETP